MYSQEILVELLQEQPDKAIPILYDKYSGALYGVIWRILKSDEDAQDILQEVFVKIWQKRDLYNGSKGRIFTWMMQIARNTSINHLQSKSFKTKEKIHSLDSDVYHISSKNKINIDALDIEDMLGKLDDKYKTVIKLAYFEGYTQKEISERLSMPIGSVKSCVKIGVRKLKSLYEGNPTIIGLITLIMLSELVMTTI
jgi:RNA polymerase sigma-70 factor (ECF subfamily)